MKKFRTAFEMEIDVTFHDPEKAKPFFLSGKNGIQHYKNLNSVAEDIAGGFQYHEDQWNSDKNKMTKFIEGFGLFVDVESDNTYELDDEYVEEAGKITIVYEMELEATSTFDIIKVDMVAVTHT